MVALDGQGYRLSVREFIAYSQQPDPRPAVMWSMQAFGLHNLHEMFTKEIEPAEKINQHFVRLGWATVANDRLQVTTLGRATYLAMEQESLEPDAVLSVVLEAQNPIAFARVVDRISNVGSALLVEPYFRLDVLQPIAFLTKVTRILTSERTDKKDRGILKLAVEATTLDRPFEIRVASREVHDRYLLPDSGSVQFIGASLNGVGQVATAMGVLTDGSDELRSLYEVIWKESTVLATAQQASTGAPGTSESHT